MAETRDCKGVSKTHLEFGVKIGKTVFSEDSNGKPIKSARQARALLASMEQADRTYDLPCAPSRKIVSRDVSEWMEYTD